MKALTNNYSYISLSILVSGLFFLSSCNNTETTSIDRNEKTPEKTPFFIETKLPKDFTKKITREKSAVLRASSTLTLSAQTSGEVQKIYQNEGKFVPSGTTLIHLRDTLNNSDLALAQAKNALAVQKANAKTTEINLEQAIQNASIALENATTKYNTLQSRNDLQYDNISDKNSIALKTFRDSYKNYYTDLERMMTQLLYEGDKIVGITGTFEHKNMRWKPFLGSINNEGTTLVEEQWDILHAKRGKIREFLEKFDENFAVNDHMYEELESTFTQIQKYIDTMMNMLHNNNIGNYLPQPLQDSWIAAWNGYRNTLQGSRASFNGWKAQNAQFIENYTFDEKATKILVEYKGKMLPREIYEEMQANPKLKLSYENLKINFDDNLKQARLSTKQAMQSLVNAKKLKEATLVQLAVAIKHAELSLQQAQRNVNKLNITTPVNGTITKILAEVGQNVTPGTPLVEFASNKPQAQIEIDTELAVLLHVGDAVSATISDGTILQGTIAAISHIASKNMLSSVRIDFPKSEKYIGKPITLKFHIPKTLAQSPLLLPIDAVEIIAEGEGNIRVFSGGTLDTKKIKLGAMHGKNIQVLTPIDPATQIITNNTSNFDVNKNILQLRNSTGSNQ